ncbi:hypothetical protein CJU90_2600 [Yarrowia sp. C11]|nr:hypothetical protein CKK34_4048 [Yarrowia sp. E02]KAG5369153.1 hypothetical protein CJU90_2600 [Yarrowia sp. C11]
MPTEMDQFPSNMARKPLTEAQKNDLIENLQLELRAKIEIRKTRVPKRYWNKTLREVQMLQEGSNKDKKPNMLNFGQGFNNNIPKFTIPQDMTTPMDLDARLNTKSPIRSPGKSLRSPMRPVTSSPVKVRPTTKPAVARSGSTATQSTASARAKVEKPEPRTRATRSTALKARQAIKNTN